MDYAESRWRLVESAWHERRSTAYGKAGKPRGFLGEVMGAAWNNLCPEFSDIGSTVNLEYILQGQRG